ncbi:no significant blast hit [Histoplasma capsulatum var. duboisii H88]|uniref:No significant blast hit n=1 Tax=Ajellomyces capsulatus (strain H88) TaxID=544711 RepID=A0A8A1LWI3_AJEC8|nr:no significant blast hit [Histoplasma capsulatum var. duboisii H88]
MERCSSEFRTGLGGNLGTILLRRPSWITIPPFFGDPSLSVCLPGISGNNTSFLPVYALQLRSGILRGSVGSLRGVSTCIIY